MAVHTGNDGPPIHEQARSVMSEDPSGYPLDALPACLRNAVTAVYLDLKAPVPLVANAALAALSLACQGHNKVASPSGGTGSVSLYFLTVAESGERKTTVEKMFTRCITDFESEHMAAAEKASKAYECDLELWKQTKKRLQTQLAKSQANGTPDLEIVERLKAHLSKFPSRPRRPRFIYADATPGALLQGLHEDLPSAGLFSSEGAIILDGAAVRNVPALNQLWDAASSIRVDRVRSESYSLVDARLTMSIMIQPDLLRRFLGRKNGEARASGLLARMLIAYPSTTQGYRFLNDDPKHYYPSLRIFNEKIKTMLEKYYFDESKGQNTAATVKFSVQAAREWREFYNRLESQLKPDGYLSDVRDHASKIAENMARMAALFHLIEGYGTEISYDSVIRAAKICNWHLMEFKRLFGDKQEISEEFHNAKILEQWFLADQSRKICWIPKSSILQYGPNKIRNKNALQNALDILSGQGKIFYTEKNKTNYIWFVPNGDFKLSPIINFNPQMTGPVRCSRLQ